MRVPDPKGGERERPGRRAVPHERAFPMARRGVPASPPRGTVLAWSESRRTSAARDTSPMNPDPPPSVAKSAAGAPWQGLDEHTAQARLLADGPNLLPRDAPRGWG